jgi:AcrR family transcriptional regulator
MSRPPGHRERKKQRTRRTIALAARELFLSKGFDETTVDEVAEASGVSRRTVFRYYPTKESMVFPARGERIERFQELMLHELARSNDPNEAVRRTCLQMVGVFEESVDELLAQHELVSVVPGLEIVDATFDKEWEATLVMALTSRLKEGSPEAMRARLRAGALIGVIRAGFNEWFQSGGELDLMQIAEEAMTMVLGPRPNDQEEQ